MANEKEWVGEVIAKKESMAGWLCINRATLGVMAVVGGLGFAEEIWRNFLAIHLKDSVTGINQAARVLEAAKYMGIFAFFVNLFEGFGYIIGGRVAHNMGARLALVVSVPATFPVVGSEIPKNRRVIALAMQSIQKRLPKVLGPLIGGVAMAVGFWLNLSLACGFVLLACIIQVFLLRRM